MGYFQVIYDSRVVNYDRRCFIRLATGLSISDNLSCNFLSFCLSASTSLSFNLGTSTLYQFLTSSQTQHIFLYRKVLLAFDSLSFCER